MDVSDYQTTETAWRYKARLENLVAQLHKVYEEQDRLVKEIDHLYDHPPMYHLFNWSA
jgi:hypothetical protein